MLDQPYQVSFNKLIVAINTTTMEFKGDHETLSEKQLNLVKSVLEEKGYKNAKVNVSPAGKKGDNYIAAVLRIEVEGEDFSMIAKIASTNPAARMMTNTPILFKNETLMYSDVLPKIIAMQAEEEIPENERFRYPAYYGSLSDELNEMLLLEDLTNAGFQIFDKMKTISDESVRLAVKALAAYHAASYAIRDREPALFDMYKNELTDLWNIVSKAPEYSIFLGLLENDAIAMLDDEKHIEAFKKHFPTILRDTDERHRARMESKYSVIQQGDCWTNNIMFKVQDGESTECCLIDYQMAKVNSPADDLLFVFFNCADYEIRSKYYNDWLDLYYNELDKHFSYYKLKSEVIYPRKQLDIDLMENSEFSFCLSALLCNMLVRDSKDALNATEFPEDMTQDQIEDVAKANSITNTDGATHLRYRKRLGGILDSYFDLGYF